MTDEQNSSHVVPIVTAWTTTTGYDPAVQFLITQEQAAEYDRCMREFAINIVSQKMPWLFQALAEADARFVGVAPCNFQVGLPDGSLRHIPELEAYLTLVPWREPGETSH